MKHLVFGAVLAAIPVSAQSANLDAFSSFHVFGDSLSDPGNLFAQAFGAPVSPFPPAYPLAQLTDGNTWATQLGADYASGTNFAHAGATAATRGAFDLVLPNGQISVDVPDFADQLAAFAQSAPVLGATPLAAVWFGANDLFAAFGAADPQGAVPTAIASAVSSIVGGVQQLADSGITTVSVFGLPDLGAIPDAQGNAAAAAAATQATAAFNATLLTGLAGVTDTEVVYVDTFAIFADILGDPGAYGFDDVTTPCLEAMLAQQTADCDGYLFYDNVHPTEAVHGLIADTLVGAVAPVPLPAGGMLLAGGLGVLGLVRRRRARC